MLLVASSALSCAPKATHSAEVADIAVGLDSPQDQEPTPDYVPRLLAAITESRGLGSMLPPPVQLLPPAALAEQVLRDIDRQTPDDVLQGQTLFLQFFGLVPDPFDLRNTLGKIGRTQLAGFYSPQERRLYINASLPQRRIQHAIAHELVHSLQVQAFSLDKRIQFQPGEADRISAVHAFAEGDATLASLPFDPRNGDLDPLDYDAQVNLARLPGVPAVVLRSLSAPYADGARFVQRLLAQGRWYRVAEAWHDPPTSTEQLLHFDKYLAREDFKDFQPLAMPSDGCHPIYEERIGEQGIRILLEEWLPKPKAAESAAGWNGDHLQLFQCTDGPWLRWQIAFDDAAQFATGTSGWSHALAAVNCVSAPDKIQPETILELGPHSVIVTLAPGTGCTSRPGLQH